MDIYIEDETNQETNAASKRLPEGFEGIIKEAIEAAAAEFGIPQSFDINVLITTPREIQKINKETRGIDSVTDVLSFPYFEFETPGVIAENCAESGENIFGDIVLCADRVVSQAKEYGHGTERELSFLTVHSMLHLLGYDHIEPEDALLMRAEEKRLMEKIGR